MYDKSYPGGSSRSSPLTCANRVKISSGSFNLGQRGGFAADFITLVRSPRRNELDVSAYIKDVLDRLLAGDTDYAALRPAWWQQAHPASIREHRVTERHDHADRKQYRRAARRPNTPLLSCGVSQVNRLGQLD